MSREEWRFMLADFRAATWVHEADPDAEHDLLLRKFLSIHQFFLRNIGRERPELFNDVPAQLLVDVVRRWIPLYRRTLAALRERFPRGPGTPDLTLAGVNWSRDLGIAYQGLLDGGSHASRFAEFWAEKSLKSPRVYETYDARMRFVGSPSYWEHFELRLAKKLSVVDELANAVPSFDLIESAAGANGADELRARYTGNGWRVETLDDSAAAMLVAARLG